MWAHNTKEDGSERQQESYCLLNYCALTHVYRNNSLGKIQWKDLIASVYSALKVISQSKFQTEIQQHNFWDVT